MKMCKYYIETCSFPCCSWAHQLVVHKRISWPWWAMLLYALLIKHFVKKPLLITCYTEKYVINGFIVWISCFSCKFSSQRLKSCSSFSFVYATWRNRPFLVVYEACTIVCQSLAVISPNLLWIPSAPVSSLSELPTIPENPPLSPSGQQELII